jgi:hypothetical protein
MHLQLKEVVQQLGEVIHNLDNNYPGIKGRICNEDGSIRSNADGSIRSYADGNIRSSINIYINKEDIRFLKG